MIIGGGWIGLLMAKELATRTPLQMVILERGAARHKEDYLGGMDELDYNVRFRLMQNYSLQTATLRYTPKDRALPIRQLGSFMPGQGTGGAGEHWGAVFPRFVPDVFTLLSSTTATLRRKEIAGRSFRAVDWKGITLATKSSRITRAPISWWSGFRARPAISKANSSRAAIPSRAGAVPKSIPRRRRRFPTTPQQPGTTLLKSLGYHPYNNPAATLSTPYTNPDGVSRIGCQYCGFCDRFGCMIGAKSQPTNTPLLPLVEKQKAITLRNGCWVRKIVYEKPKGGGPGKATGVVYIDEKGEETFQPADIVFLGTWTVHNTRLLLLSGIGEPYDPNTGKGVVGRNLTHQVSFTAAQAFFDKPLNRFMGAAPAGLRMADFDGDAFDHSNVPFVRGGTIAGIGQGFQPIVGFGTVPPSVKARWGSDWKKAAVYWYDRVGAVGFAGEHIAYKDHFMDLDPTYKDHLGDPLIRRPSTSGRTMNAKDEIRFPQPSKGVELAKAMGAKEIAPSAPYGHYDPRRYQSTHVQGGTIMGKSPGRGVRGQHLHGRALAGAEPLRCMARVHVRHSTARQSHADGHRADVSHRRRGGRALREKAGDAGIATTFCPL